MTKVWEMLFQTTTIRQAAKRYVNFLAGGPMGFRLVSLSGF
jgi:hypothetical protein